MSSPREKTENVPSPEDQSNISNAEGSQKKSIGRNLFEQFMAGISYVIPFIVGGGIINALSIALSSAGIWPEFAAVLSNIGNASFGMMSAVMAMFTAFTIADTPALVPGMVAGVLASNYDCGGFVGAILGGFIAGYVTLFFVKLIGKRVSAEMQGTVNILVYPLVCTLIAGLAMMYVVRVPIVALNDIVYAGLEKIESSNAGSIVLCMILGAMCPIDYGGVLCRVAYAFCIITVAESGGSMVMAANHIGGEIVGLSLALSALICPQKFTAQERTLSKSGWVMGASSLVEAGIPFAARDPIIHIAAHAIGGAISGAVVALLHVSQNTVHGGLWLMLIPGTIDNKLGYLLAVLAGTVFATVVMCVFKKTVDPDASRKAKKAAKSEI